MSTQQGQPEESESFAVIGEDGWRAPSDPPEPNVNKYIQIAWDDMSFGPNSIGFYAGVEETPDSGRRYYWTKWLGHWTPKCSDMIGAWRELDK